MTIEQWIAFALAVIFLLLALVGLFYLHLRDRRERKAKTTR